MRAHNGRSGRLRTLELAGKVVAAACSLAVLQACGGDAYPTTANPPIPAPPVRGEPQPASPSGAFEPTEFANIPVPSGAKPLGEPQVHGTLTLRSWEVVGRTPKQLLDFYNEQLPAAGWKVLQPPAPAGPVVMTGQWTKPKQQLQATATSLDSQTSYRTQLDLQVQVY